MKAINNIRRLDPTGRDNATVKVIDDNIYFFCTPAYARRLLKQKKAKKIERSPVLTIQLTRTK